MSFFFTETNKTKWIKFCNLETFCLIIFFFWPWVRFKEIKLHAQVWRPSTFLRFSEHAPNVNKHRTLHLAWVGLSSATNTSSCLLSFIRHVPHGRLQTQSVTSAFIYSFISLLISLLGRKTLLFTFIETTFNWNSFD